MRFAFVRLVLPALAAAWAAAPAHGQTTGQITSGNATFQMNATPLSESPQVFTDYYEGAFRPDGTTNHLYAQWLFYRVAGDGKERPLGTYTKTGGGDVTLTGTPAGDTMTYDFTETASGGATRFTGTWTLQLQDGAVPGEANLLHTVTIDNPTASPLTLSLFHYLDFDLGETIGGHSATGDLNGMTVTGGSVYGTYTPTDADAFQASAGFPPLDVGLLDDAETNLDNTGLPMSDDDWTGAYQWNLVIAPGGSAVIQFGMGVTPVPEPGAVLALAAAGLGLAGLARRARLIPRG